MLSRKPGASGQIGSAHPDRYGTFSIHDEQMKRFRQLHGGMAGLGIAVMMRLELYTIRAAMNSGGTVTISPAELPGLCMMRRPPSFMFAVN